MAAQDYQQVFAGAPDGGQVGASATEKVGFWGVDPVVQPAAAAQAALTSTTVTASSPYGFVTATAASAAIALLGAIRTALVDAGIMKGAA